MNTGLEKSKPLYRSKWPMGPALNSGFISIKRLGVLLLPPGWDDTHLYTWLKISTVRVKCLA